MFRAPVSASPSVPASTPSSVSAPRGSLRDLVAQRLLYPVGYDGLWVVDAETRTIRQHLEELVAAGRVREEDDGRFARVG